MFLGKSVNPQSSIPNPHPKGIEDWGLADFPLSQVASFSNFLSTEIRQIHEDSDRGCRGLPDISTTVLDGKGFRYIGSTLAAELHWTGQPAGSVAHAIVALPAMEHDVSTNPKGHITPEEYLEIERRAEFRSEYLDGEMFAMSGVTREHNIIEVNILTELNLQLVDLPCEVFGANMRTRVSLAGLYTYPDVAVVCGEPEFEDDRLDTLINPQAIVEVLSDSTESYDRGKKFAHYRQIVSLREYILVSQYECRIERFERQGDGDWLYSELTDPNASMALPSIGCHLSLHSVYRKVDFERARQRREQRMSGPAQ